jgi:uncharacterized protein YrrD
MPVLELETGERMGVVTDVYFDAEHHTAKLLVVERTGILAGNAVIPLADIRSVGEDAVTIETAALSEEWQAQPGVRCLLSGDDSWVGKELFTENGTVLGTVADVYIGEESENIVGYEVSDGLLADLVTGRKWLPFAHTVQVGEQIIVKSDAKLSELQVDA